MLYHLQLKNIAITRELEVEFQPGLTVITGETGAGKSLIIHALKLLLGDRAQKHWLRQDTTATISAGFLVGALPEAKAWLQAHDYDDGDTCLLRRILSVDGRTKTYINGQACTLSELKSLGQHLVSIHGQHEGQRLLQPSFQCALLDMYSDAKDLSETVSQHFQAWQKAEKSYQACLSGLKEREQRIEFLRFQLEEFESLNLTPAYIQQLDEEQKLLANSEEIIYNSQKAHEILASDTGVLEKLAEVQQLLRHVPLESYKTSLQALDEVEIQLQEVAHDLQHAVENIQASPERLQALEAELGQLYTLARKHHTTVEQLHVVFASLETELDSLDASDQQLEKLKKTVAAEKLLYEKTANELSIKRAKGAKNLEQKITTLIRTLGMPAGQFYVKLISLEKASASGYEKISFEVNLNPGQASGPLNKIASGGELSRISLAIHVATAALHKTPTLIFDEVDSGISGEVATAVGELLQTLATNCQIVTITHLPQVAAKGAQHFYVSKTTKNKETQSCLTLLEKEARISAIAALLSGAQHDDAKQLAKTLLES